MKPDIIFFGESLPAQFLQGIDLIKQADLLIIMGTSLKVMPFCKLVDLCGEKVKKVLINRENTVGINGDNFLFMEGDIDESIEKIVKECEWSLDGDF